MLDLVTGGRHLVFQSPLSLEDATKRLEREVAAPTARVWRAMEWKAWERRPQAFVGEFVDGRFHMIRLLRDERSRIRPWLDGTLSRAASGCRVDVRLKMPVSAIVLCVPFMLLGALIVFSGVFGLPGTAIGGIMVLAPVYASIREAQKATEMLGALFESTAPPSADAGGDGRAGAMR